MQSSYDDTAAPSDPLELRAYTSRLLGREPSLVLHGGGNTSVKVDRINFFGDEVRTLCVKGSGWDLASIEPAGFSPVRLDVLLRMAALETLSDPDMVRESRAALLEPSAPNPSVEAILHATIPPAWVDHTHADAIVTLTNTPDGEARVRALYGDRVIYVPYVMPGFVLARKVYELTRDVDWSRVEGMILMNHGAFTWGDDAKTSYERMIRLVSDAEEALGDAAQAPRLSEPTRPNLIALATIRKEASSAAGRALVARFDGSAAAAGFASRDDVANLATRGPVTPDHVIRTKPVPAVIDGESHAEIASDIERFTDGYSKYFDAHGSDDLTMLDPAPRWAVWKGRGVVGLGTTAKAARQVEDIARHTVSCLQVGEALGGWTPLGAADLFDMEYWELEQRKLKRGGKTPPFMGRVALITGGATGIGRAIAEELRAQGAAICVLDIQPAVVERFVGPDALGVVCDVTDRDQVDQAIERCVETFGGLDLLVTNAGNFPASQPIAELDEANWQRTMDLNVSGHMRAMRAATPFLELGVDPSILVIASRNVTAPGPGAAAYSASKAALTQLARVAALELAPKGVRVNLLHPDKVFDTELWSDDKIALRAEHYGLTIEGYKRSNLLGVEVTTVDVAAIACALLSPIFRSTTGAQIPVDGGNERVI